MSINQMVQYLSARVMFRILLVSYSLYKYSKTLQCQSNNSLIKFHLFSHIPEFIVAEKTCHRVSAGARKIVLGRGQALAWGADTAPSLPSPSLPFPPLPLEVGPLKSS